MAPDDPYLCISDFIAPVESEVNDYIGIFGVSCGFGALELSTKYIAFVVYDIIFIIIIWPGFQPAVAGSEENRDCHNQRYPALRKKNTITFI